MRHGIDVEERGDRHGLVLAVRGELDLAGLPVLLARVGAALNRRPPRLRLELARVTFAQAAAVAALIDVRRAAVRAGVELEVVAGDSALRRLLTLSGHEAAVHGRARARLRDRPRRAPASAPPPSLPTGSGHVLVRLEGELDVAGTRTLEARLARLRRERRDVLVDLRPLRFCDAAGLGALVRCARAAEADGVALSTTPATGAVHRLIELTGTARLLAAAPGS